MNSFATLLQRYFSARLIQQRSASPHTIAAYRDSFRLLFRYVQRVGGKTPATLSFEDLDADLIAAFLLELERSGASVRTRNLRLTAIRSFFRYAAIEEPLYARQIQRVLAIPGKRQHRREVAFLSRVEIEALLAQPDRSTWLGRRDFALLQIALQTGLRISELRSLQRADVILGAGAHVRCNGKGRKERCTPLTKETAAIVRAWLNEPQRNQSLTLFPNALGKGLSSDAIQRLLAKYVQRASARAPTLRSKRVSPHVLRHTAAMRLLEAGVDSSVIALWLGHESVETTQAYLHAHLELKRAALAKTSAMPVKVRRFRPSDQLMAYLESL